MNENEKWLKEKGYKQRDFDGLYYYEYKKEGYGAFNSFTLTDVIHAPLEHIKNVHKCFLEKAEKKEVF